MIRPFRMFVAYDIRLSVDVLLPSTHVLLLVAAPHSPLLAIGAMDAVPDISRLRPTNGIDRVVTLVFGVRLR